MSRLANISQRFANTTTRAQTVGQRFENVCARFNANGGAGLGDADLLFLENCLAAIETQLGALENSATQLELRANALGC